MVEHLDQSGPNPASYNTSADFREALLPGVLRLTDTPRWSQAAVDGTRKGGIRSWIPSAYLLISGLVSSKSLVYIRFDNHDGPTLCTLESHLRPASRSQQSCESDR